MLFRSQFVVIHTVKGFRIVNEAEVDIFLEFPCFLYDPTNVDNLISGSSAYLKPTLAAYQAPPSMGFSRQEYWSGLPLPSPPALQEDSLPQIHLFYLKYKA